LSKRTAQIVDEVSHCDKRQDIKQGGYLMGGVIGHALNIGLEYIDKIRKGSANCRGFFMQFSVVLAH